jgi:hypothetical protein
MTHGAALHLPAPTGAPSLTPYARRFNGSSDYMTFGTGSLDVAAQKYGTIAALFRQRVNNVWQGLFQFSQSNNDSCFAIELADDNSMTLEQDAGFSYGQTSFDRFTVADGWVIGGWKKGVGFVQPINFKLTLAGAFSTVTVSQSVHDSSSTIHHIDIGLWQDRNGNHDWGNFDFAKIAYWENIVLTDTQLQTLDDSDASWMSLSPTWGITFKQASTGTSVPDDTGGGGNQTSITGTSVVSDGPALSGYGS